MPDLQRSPGPPAAPGDVGLDAVVDLVGAMEKIGVDVLEGNRFVPPCVPPAEREC
jgi:hypothetical protein